MKKILIVTGEASGDLHGASLIRELKTLIPSLKVFGIGGERLKAEGAELVCDVKDIAVVGFLEIIPKFFHIRRAMKLLYQKMLDEQPDLCLLIDYPGFNLRFAKLSKKHGIKVVYYILPQIWAWGSWRLRSIYRWVDEGVSILPFESEFYKEIRIEFVGHPLLDIITEDRRQKTEDRKQKTENKIALVPGSRKEEVKRILPIMLKCAERLSGFEFVIPVASGIDKNWVEKLVGAYCNTRLHSKIKVVNNNVYEELRGSTLALVGSGTATLEACILGVPSIIIYRVSLVSYIMGRVVVKIPWIGLPNIIANKEVMPEFIQFNAEPSKIVAAVHQILEDREKVVATLREVKVKLGSPGAVSRVAQILYKSLKS